MHVLKSLYQMVQPPLKSIGATWARRVPSGKMIKESPLQAPPIMMLMGRADVRDRLMHNWAL